MKTKQLLLITSILLIGNNSFGQFSKMSSEGNTLIKEIAHDHFRIQGAKVHIGGDESSPTTADYNLYVEAGILSESIKVANPQDWSDFVFSKDYKLKNLIEVEKFINENKHLPDVPSEKELLEQGYYDQHEINKVLLQKIEELMLYIIEQQKEIDGLKSSKSE